MIIELLQNRFSVRKYEDRPVPQEVLHTMLEAGRLSPSGGNEQPWKFGVLTDRQLITRVAALACGQTWLANAPLLIVLCAVPVEDARGGRDIQCQRYPQLADDIRKIDQDLYWMLNQEEHQTKIAGAHMALAALEYGIGSCWVSRFDVPALARLLGLPSGILPAEVLAFGYPAHIRKAPAKKFLEEIVFYNRYSTCQTVSDK
jgi:nitroreductase